VYIGGGVAPRILAHLRMPTFMDAFLAKGRMRRLLEAMPVRVVLNDKAALLGAGWFAARALAASGAAAPVGPPARRRVAEVRVLPDAPAMAQTAAELFVRHARRAVEARGRFCVALSGGSTPRALFVRLATEPALRDAVPWNQTHLFWGDERHVAPDAAESNYRMTRDALLDHVPLPRENVHPMVPASTRLSTGAPGEAVELARAYQEVLERSFALSKGVLRQGSAQALPSFDLVLLGMGADGHTASLFPDSPALGERTQLVVANWIERFSAFRITLTAPVINAARAVVFLVSGADKATTLSAVLHGPDDARRLPAQLIDPQTGTLLWLVDRAAAGMLSA
jgi:6-phosphogluconolactonase